MSNFKGHNIAGTIAATVSGGVGYLTFPLPMALAGALATYLFALFPDLDTKSTPSKVFYGGILLLLGVLYFQGLYQQATKVAIVAIVPQILTHRGFLHSIWASLLIPTALTALFFLGVQPIRLVAFLALCGVLGYWTHLILDRVL